MDDDPYEMLMRDEIQKPVGIISSRSKGKPNGCRIYVIKAQGQVENSLLLQPMSLCIEKNAPYFSIVAADNVVNIHDWLFKSRAFKSWYVPHQRRKPALFPHDRAPLPSSESGPKLKMALWQLCRAGGKGLASIEMSTRLPKVRGILANPISAC